MQPRQEVMVIISIGLAIAAFLVGLLAAWFWWKASTVNTGPAFPEAVKQNPGDANFVQSMSLWGLLNAVNESSRLNKWAALLTALAVVLSTASTLVAALNF